MTKMFYDLTDREHQKEYFKNYRLKAHLASRWIECGCGCGEKMKEVGKSGRVSQFIKNHDKKINLRFGSNAANWRGGVRTGRDGYVRMWLSPEDARDHPSAYQTGTVGGWSIHRSHYVWNINNPESKVDKSNGEIIHHINHVRDDDRIENLQKMDGVLHARLHGLKAI